MVPIEALSSKLSYRIATSCLVEYQTIEGGKIMELTELSSVKEDEEKAIYDRLTDLGYLD